MKNNRIVRTLIGGAALTGLVALPVAPAQATSATMSATSAVSSAAANFSLPDRELAGKLLKAPNSEDIYLIDPSGYRRLTPAATFNKLFRDDVAVKRTAATSDIALGPSLSGATLIKSDEDAKVYLLCNNTKRWIVSPAVFTKYGFDWGKIKLQEQDTVDDIPNGPQWK